MDSKDENKLGGICGYARSKFEERAEHRRKRRSLSESGVAPRGSTKKLRKPPQVRSVSEKPRNRLRKPIALAPTPTQQLHAYASAPTIDVFVLEYEPYPQSVEPGNVLGVYSTFNAVTFGAFTHGAYTFSREGLLDGHEYLSPTGRIKLVRTTVQNVGVRAPVPERNDSLQGSHVRLDIPHPESQPHDPDQTPSANKKPIFRDTVFVVIRTGPRAASWIGVFADKSLAWGACLKDKAMCETSAPLCEEVRAIGDGNMPEVSGRLVGTGRFTWKVVEHAIDQSKRTPIATIRDV